MSDSISEVVREFAISKSRFESLVDDPRLFAGTAQGFKDLAAGGPIEFPTKDWSQEDAKAWWRNTGPAFAALNGKWAGTIPKEIESLVSKKDIKHKDIPLRILKKKDSASDLPVVLYYHGGGFSAWSSKDPAYDGYLTRLAALGESTIVAVDYRLAVDAPFPAGLDDSYTIAKWVSQGGAVEFGVSSGKVVLAGDSAGSNIAFGTAIKAKRACEDFVAGLYLICPYSAWATAENSSDKYPSMAEFDGYYASEGLLIAVGLVTCNESEKEKWTRSPLLVPLCASKEEMAGLPPTSVVVGELDMIRDMGMELHLRLKDAGVESMLTMNGGAIHEQQLFAKHSPQLTNQSIRDLAGFAQYVTNKDYS